MIDINSQILSEMRGFRFETLGINYYDLKRFMIDRMTFLDRRWQAIKIIEDILTYHGKERLLAHVAELARIEHGIKELEPWVRDHVVHALLSFILGTYLNEKFMTLFNDTKVDYFQWKLAGLLHDVAYPAQIAKDILKPFSEKINLIKRELEITAPDIFFQIVPRGLDTLSNGVNSLELIQNQINEWNLEINAKNEYTEMIDSGKICHGMISGLAVLYVVDLLYQKYNPGREFRSITIQGYGIDWNQKYFEEDVVAACTAIFIHNLNRHRFKNAKINPHRAPLAFLLKLSDLLQEWERPSFENRHGFAAEKFDIRIADGILTFTADEPEDRKENLRNELNSCLFSDNIRIK